LPVASLKENWKNFS